jgi:hypothetical protein
MIFYDSHSPNYSQVISPSYTLSHFEFHSYAINHEELNSENYNLFYIFYFYFYFYFIFIFIFIFIF